jgi:hypothetical protein
MSTRPPLSFFRRENNQWTGRLADWLGGCDELSFLERKTRGGSVPIQGIGCIGRVDQFFEAFEKLIRRLFCANL